MTFGIATQPLKRRNARRITESETEVSFKLMDVPLILPQTVKGRTPLTLPRKNAGFWVDKHPRNEAVKDRKQDQFLT
ncbi:hypothetical protein ERW51_02425 [Aliivibrio finisterrensis]|uniref:hypothetical protein n=1 Tax=Aliivibrio finisterrensis TaxID=511998 RepID=UPI00101F295D|nr:hypothetical protein [Aliivibrio finisterrensis]RYU70388.1 hypothetical protein ERW54_02430 [Aliivibrio finisterrensis]RYU74250.1 hypothetical protein ERW51_02425 [Aliivibrio finisterrensis]RYU76855.1 hypothetical protein ERW48_02440 [Aliivibrio finisterrensis]